MPSPSPSPAPAHFPSPALAAPLRAVRAAPLGLWASYLLGLALPLYNLAFLITGPHRWYASLPWILVLPALVLLERNGPPAGERTGGAPRWSFDVLLYAAAILHLLDLALFGRL